MYATTINDLYREFCERCGEGQELTRDELQDAWKSRVGLRYEDATPEQIEDFFDAVFADMD